jgi:type VI secretion system secreted protein Hcp
VGHAFYVSIEGQKQGKFRGSVNGGKPGRIAGIRFSAETTSPRDAATGMASGKRQHKPITITKEWDASSPQLFRAIVTNEVLKTILFEFVRTDPGGKEHVHYTIKLTNAAVADVRSYLDLTDTSGDPYDGHELEDVAFTFQTIEVADQDGKTTAADDWHATA